MLLRNKRHDKTLGFVCVKVCVKVAPRFCPRALDHQQHNHPMMREWPLVSFCPNSYLQTSIPTENQETGFQGSLYSPFKHHTKRPRRRYLRTLFWWRNRINPKTISPPPFPAWCTSSAETGSPLCAWAMRRSATPKRSKSRAPAWASSARPQISKSLGPVAHVWCAKTVYGVPFLNGWASFAFLWKVCVSQIHRGVGSEWGGGRRLLDQVGLLGFERWKAREGGFGEEEERRVRHSRSNSRLSSAALLSLCFLLRVPFLGWFEGQPPGRPPYWVPVCFKKHTYPRHGQTTPLLGLGCDCH